MDSYFGLLKTLFYNFKEVVRIIISILLFVIPMHLFSQQDFFRGNGNDDMYLSTVSHNKRIICRFSDYGKAIDIKADNFGGLIEYAEPTEGTVIGSMHFSIYKSTDAGLTFAPIAMPSNRIQAIFGGTIPGEILMYCNHAANINFLQLFKSYDNGLTQNLVKDTVHYPFYVKAGSVSGEFYSDFFTEEGVYLCHSLDFGATFDTIPYAQSIFQQTSSHFKAECCGTQAGELYLVTGTNTCPSHYYIYRSVDYGKKWDLQSEQTFACNEFVHFACGRESGTFYILHEKESFADQFLNVEFCSSSDSGKTFKLYEYELAHSLTIPENEDLQPFSVWPNPASEEVTIEYNVRNDGIVKLNISTVEGKSLTTLFVAYQSAGQHKYKLNVRNYTPGVYLISLDEGIGYQACYRLVISK